VVYVAGRTTRCLEAERAEREPERKVLEQTRDVNEAERSD
jgi:hypothetical protein